MHMVASEAEPRGARELQSLGLVVIYGYDHEPINRYNAAPSARVEIISANCGRLGRRSHQVGMIAILGKGERFRSDQCLG